MIVHLSCVASDCSLLFLKKGDPSADLRDADGFCYRLIRTVLSENLHKIGCKISQNSPKLQGIGKISAKKKEK